MSSILKHIKLLLPSNKISNYYELVGTQNTWGHGQLCLNLGYWRKATTMEDANNALFELVGKSIDFQNEDSILDVGFGFGDQDFYWKSNFKFKKLTGVNISKVQVDIANERLNQLEFDFNNIEFIKGDATQLEFQDNSFDKIISLESAFHYNTRNKFLKEAYKKLKPGGKLIMADIIFSPNNSGFRNKISRYFHMLTLQYNKKNICTIEQYIQSLNDIGFLDVKYFSIYFFTFYPFREYVLSNRGIEKKFLLVYQIWNRIMPLFSNTKKAHKWDYIILTAYKPDEKK